MRRRRRKRRGGGGAEVGLPSRGRRGLRFFDQVNPPRPLQLASLTLSLFSLLASLNLQFASLLLHLSVMAYTFLQRLSE
jgi:hypothetical protein